MCRCIADYNENLAKKNARIILVNDGSKIVPCIATERIKRENGERIPLPPAKFCPFCGEEIK
jgi:D-lyxose ketol-isomerase